MNNYQKENYSAPIILNFNNLPNEIRAKLRQRINGKYGDFFHKKSNNLINYLLIVLGFSWCVFVFFLANDFLWKNFKIILFSLLTFIFSGLFYYGIFRIFKSLTSFLENGILVTSHFIITLNFNNIKFWDLEQLYSVNSQHIYRNESYQSTIVTLHLENDKETFQINNLTKAEEIVEKIEQFRKCFIEAVARNDESFFRTAEDFVVLKKQKSGFNKNIANYLSYVLIGIISVFTTTGIMFGAISVNNYFDDKRSWNEAQKTNRASSFRNYLQSHPNGRWQTLANQNLDSLFETAEQKYQESLNKGFDPKAVEAVKQTIRYAKETKNYHVKIIYERHNEIAPDIAEQLKKYFEVNKVLTLGDSFSDEKLKERENILSDKIAEAFNVVIPNDILEFSEDCNNDCINFIVKYTIDSDSIYYNTLQEKIPDKDRVWRPGVWFDWNFNIKTPNNEKVYSFKFDSDAAQDIYYDSKIDETDVGKDTFEKKMEAEKNQFYDALVVSAFDDFKKVLIYKTGIGDEPVRNIVSNDTEEKSNNKNKK